LVFESFDFRRSASIMPGMKKYTLAAIGILLLLCVGAGPRGKFDAKQITIDGVPVVRLSDAGRGIEVSVLPSFGNMAFEMKVHGKNILFFPEMKLSDFQKKPMQTGIPFMAPWANRLDETGFWANGRKYSFDMALGNVRKDNNSLPIHGLLPADAAWEVTRVQADGKSASVTSGFDFWRYPDLMAQWPIAHAYEMTYRLADGALEVRTTVSNLSREAMPLAIGFHPYYQIPGVPRDQWMLRMPARSAVIADERRMPTGEFRPLDLPNPLPLKDRTLDDGFTDLARNAEGRAVFTIESDGKRIELIFGPGYPVAVVWEPAKMEFICVEPMTGVTNAINLHHAGKYPGLQTIPAGGQWTGSFWIRPEGI